MWRYHRLRNRRNNLFVLKTMLFCKVATKDCQALHTTTDRNRSRTQHPQHTASTTHCRNVPHIQHVQQTSSTSTYAACSCVPVHHKFYMLCISKRATNRSFHILNHSLNTPRAGLKRFLTQHMLNSCHSCFSGSQSMKQ